MRHILYVVTVIILTAGVAAAQDFPTAEIFGGYSLLKIGGSDVDALIDQFEITAPSEISTKSSKLFKRGFDASVTINANEYFGIEANFLYNRGDLLTAVGTIEGQDVDAKVTVSDFAFMAGPRLTSRKNETLTPFAHALFGVDHIKLDPSLIMGGSDLSQDLAEFGASDNGFGMALGGGIDVKVNKVFGIRLIQADYFMAKHEDTTVNNLVLSFGAVISLGGQ